MGRQQNPKARYAIQTGGAVVALATSYKDAVRAARASLAQDRRAGHLGTEYRVLSLATGRAVEVVR